ncbi:MAG TPA: hypothetical protein HA254_04495 [Candidatus Diapherotrites archaeon]|uniref:HEAT repeat domain-containing protein n=1 Tax=Candidatus Iainarchaeum sp. TaxID=3101447 RepID=A0A7J4IWQ1_9ARCH|nr:hypothetical protein [Candidatus Diapherotrites archaeon]
MILRLQSGHVPRAFWADFGAIDCIETIEKMVSDPFPVVRTAAYDALIHLEALRNKLQERKK